MILLNLIIITTYMLTISPVLCHNNEQEPKVDVNLVMSLKWFYNATSVSIIYEGLLGSEFCIIFWHIFFNFLCNFESIVTYILLNQLKIDSEINSNTLFFFKHMVNHFNRYRSYKTSLRLPEGIIQGNYFNADFTSLGTGKQIQEYIFQISNTIIHCTHQAGGSSIRLRAIC